MTKLSFHLYRPLPNLSSFYHHIVMIPILFFPSPFSHFVIPLVASTHVACNTYQHSNVRETRHCWPSQSYKHNMFSFFLEPTINNQTLLSSCVGIEACLLRNGIIRVFFILRYECQRRDKKWIDSLWVTSQLWGDCGWWCWWRIDTINVAMVQLHRIPAQLDVIMRFGVASARGGLRRLNCHLTPIDLSH